METKLPPATVDDEACATRAGLTEAEMRRNVVQLAFGGDTQKLLDFCAAVKEGIPPGTAVVLRGSAVTGFRWADQSPFDADGPGTSDLDLTLVGEAVLGLYNLSGFFIPGMHTRPLSDEDPDIAPDLVALRTRLQEMVGRPVNIQATREIVMTVREHVMDQPYLTLLEREDG